jgi:hypothetical protein
MLWNPFSTRARPLATLKGHMASVIDIAISERSNQIISLSLDKTIKVRRHGVLELVCASMVPTSQAAPI